MDKLNFIERLLQLCRDAGYTEKEKNLPRKLARELIDKGIVDCNSDYDTEVDRIRCQIREDFNNNKHTNPPFNRIDWYCRLFKCSADYLMGYIDFSTHELKSISETLCIDSYTANVLLNHSHTMISPVLDALISDSSILDIFNAESDYYNATSLSKKDWEQYAFSEAVLSLFQNLYYFVSNEAAIDTIAIDKGLPSFEYVSVPENTDVLFKRGHVVVGGLNSKDISSIILSKLQMDLLRIREYKLKQND